ncbi:sugar ABC transporter ATP-binding protein [soil metagenome]
MSILEAKNIGKVFPGVVALDSVNVSFEAGTVHALMGENGAGKSTLGKILAGLYQPDSGEISFEGKVVHFRSPGEAVKAGISMVHQELLFAENLTVAENLCLGDLPHRGILLDRAQMVTRAKEWLTAIGSDIDPNTTLGNLPISKQQLVQIAGGIGKGAKVLIFDEPTSSLSQAEALRLLDLIRDLKAKGLTCLYVSHRLEEIFAVCDAITVLRDGKLVDTVQTKDVDRAGLVRKMIGRDLAQSLSKHTHDTVGAEIMRVDNLSSQGKFADISFSVRAGEILGLAGLVGAGRTEITEALFGLDSAATGSVTINGKNLGARTPRSAMAARMGLVPEDRKRHGLVLSMNSRENVSLPTLKAMATMGVVNRPKERGIVEQFFEKMKVKAPSIDTPSAGLSGGNQQKLVLAKGLAANCDLLIVDEPTRGVDVGAKAEIHNLIRALAAEGKAILLISSDLPELLALSTRILVMRNGEIVDELPEGASEQEVMMPMAGLVASG